MWKGVIIEESLEDQSILKDVKIVLRKSAYLEREEGKGKFHFDKVEVDDFLLHKVIDVAKNSLKKGWYMHLCSGDTMFVIFKNLGFEYKKGSKPSLDQIRRYGKSMGINEAQLPSESLLDDPWG